jgi:hypothetical protein
VPVEQGAPGEPALLLLAGDLPSHSRPGADSKDHAVTIRLHAFRTAFGTLFAFSFRRHKKRLALWRGGLLYHGKPCEWSLALA